MFQTTANLSGKHQRALRYLVATGSIEPAGSKKFFESVSLAVATASAVWQQRKAAAPTDSSLLTTISNLMHHTVNPWK